jgi:PBS lyase HEAT-like repeat
LLGEALRHLGLRLSVEQDSELQGLVSAAFVRLSQEAATSRQFPAMEQALDLIAGVESQRPGIARTLRGKMGIEERVPDFVEEALKARHVAAGLTNVLKLLPQTTMEQLSTRFNRCSLRDDSEHVANLAADLGEEAVQYLRSTVRGGPIAEAVEMAGLLSRLDPQSVMVYLPGRMKDFPRGSQDRIVRQISASGAVRRCHILMELLDHVDPMVAPLVIDEIGVTADRDALGRLLTIVDGDLPPGGGPYLRVKAIEALGRIQAPESASTLKRLVESKKVFRWLEPQELRIAALQALEKIDPEWVHEYLPISGIDKEDFTLAPLDIPVTSKFVRQRRHTRVRLRKTVRAVCTNLKEGCSMEIKTASLTGGVATLSRHLIPGTQVQLKLQVGMRALQATALMRDSRAQDMAFEIVDMNLDERSKYRRMLAGNLSPNSNLQEPADAEVVVPARVANSR